MTHLVPSLSNIFPLAACVHVCAGVGDLCVCVCVCAHTICMHTIYSIHISHTVFSHFFFAHFIISMFILFYRTSVLFVSISFIVLMIISFVWLVFYYVQRFRYLQTKDRKSVSLCFCPVPFWPSSSIGQSICIADAAAIILIINCKFRNFFQL